MNIYKKIQKFKNFLDENNIKYKKYIYILVLSTIISNIFLLVLPYIAKLEIDQLQYQNFSFLKISWFNIFVIISILYFLLDFLSKYVNDFFRVLSKKYYEKISSSISLIIIDKLNNMEYGILFDSKLNDILSQLSYNLEELLEAIIKFFTNILWSLLFLIGISYIFFKINIYILPVIFVWVFIQYKLEKYMEFLHKKYESSKIDDNIDLQYAKRIMMRDPIKVITNNLGFFLKNKIKKLNNMFIETRYKIDLLNSKLFNISSSLSKIIELIIKIFVWYSIFYFWESIWTITMTLLFSNRIAEIFKTILNLKRDFISLDYKLNLYDFLDKILQNKYKWNIENLKLEKITIRNLKFKYPSLNDIKNTFYKIENDYAKKLANKKLDYIEEKSIENAYVLENINLTFEKWKIYWIIWKNWAWKSTLLHLILKAFNTRNIFYNENSILEINRNFFINNVWIITQIPTILPYSIKENICLWKDIDENKIYEYLDYFWIKEKILKSPKKLDSKIMQDIELSGWERQLIAIIRMLIQDYQILILDEWTNQLDVENENKVIKLLHKIKKDKIILFVTHRMTIINKADFIYSIENKTIKDAWTPENLLKQDSLFKKFYNLEINRT